MRTRALPVLLSVCLVPVLAGRALGQTADEVIEKHLAALGGRAALGKLTSRHAVGTITVSTAGGDLTGPVELFAKPPNKTRVLMELDLSALGVPQKMTIDQKFDGATGWVLNSMQGDTEMGGDQLASARNNRFPNSLLAYKAAGTTVELLPKEQVDGKEAFVILTTPTSGPATKLYFDAESYLMIRTVATINSPDAGPVEQTSDFSDYREVGGVKTPFRIVNANALQSATIMLSKVEHNVPIEDAIFSVKRPASARR